MYQMSMEKQILQKLNTIEKEVREIKTHMREDDSNLTADEIRLLDESLEHEKEGKLVSLKHIEHVRSRVR